jgi:hypothetical protein
VQKQRAAVFCAMRNVFLSFLRKQESGASVMKTVDSCFHLRDAQRFSVISAKAGSRRVRYETVDFLLSQK